MRARFLIIAALAAPLASAATAEALTMPSGYVAQSLPVIWDEDVSAIRLRFVLAELAAPDGAYLGDQELIFEDMRWLCETQISALQVLGGDPREDGWEGVVVTLMDRDVPFGMVDTGSTQLFEWFSLSAEGCDMDWDAYHD